MQPHRRPRRFAQEDKLEWQRAILVACIVYVMSNPYRHPAPMPELTAKHWSVSEWQKVFVRACHWLPWTMASRRWYRAQDRRISNTLAMYWRGQSFPRLRDDGS